MAASRQLEHSDKSVETSGKKRQLVSGECADRRRGLRHTDGQGPTIPRKVCRPRGNELDSESFTIDLGDRDPGT